MRPGLGAVTIGITVLLSMDMVGRGNMALPDPVATDIPDKDPTGFSDHCIFASGHQLICQRLIKVWNNLLQVSRLGR
jgi:hypothetical protein